MRAHIIENNKVVNTIEVESLDFLPNLIDGSIGGIGWELIDGTLVEPYKEPIVIRVTTITDLQARLALNQLGVLADVEAFAVTNHKFNIWFDRALVWERDNAVLNEAVALFGWTDKQLDDLFILASTL